MHEHFPERDSPTTTAPPAFPLMDSDEGGGDMGTCKTATLVGASPEVH